MPQPPLVELTEVSKRYSGLSGRDTHLALDRVSFRLSRGTSTGIVGLSGSGKSTLARLILGLEQPTFGSVAIAGRPVRYRCRADRKWIRRKAQMVWQDPVVYLNPYRTARQVLGEALSILGMERHRQEQRIADLFRMVRLPRELLLRRPHEMSGGQAQRLSIARAIAMEPELMICDEILSGLDLPNQVNLIELLGSFQAERNLTLLLIGHDLAPVVKLCRRLLVLSEGRIVFDGTPAGFVATSDNPATRMLACSFMERDLLLSGRREI